MNSDQMNSFYTNGYCKMAFHLQSDGVERIIAHCKRLSYNPIFGDVDGKMDSKRSQAMVKDCVETNQLFVTLKYILKHTCPQWEIKEVAALRSDPNGAIQDIHRDSSLPDVEETFLKTGALPISVVIALMPNTRLCIFDNCFGNTTKVDQSRKRIINIEVGECLIFRRDLAHCGVSYKDTNYRLYAAIAVEDLGWEPDTVYGVLFKTHKCVCGMQFFVKDDLNEHLRSCKQGRAPRKRLFAEDQDSPNYPPFKMMKLELQALFALRSLSQA